MNEYKFVIRDCFLVPKRRSLIILKQYIQSFISLDLRHHIY